MASPFPRFTRGSRAVRTGCAVHARFSRGPDRFRGSRAVHLSSRSPRLFLRYSLL